MKIVRTTLLASTLAALLAGCGAPDGPASNASDLSTSNGLANNGLANNGLANNGLANNGLANNGLANNGLTLNALQSTAFLDWFAADPAFADMVMRYLVRCAHPSSSSLSFTYSRKTYTWPGLLGLAPGWATGSAATEAEEQIITACMASLANKYGKTVPISLQGRSALGVPIPLLSTELTDYSVREGCFFGNLFSGEGVYAGYDHAPYNDQYSTARACAFDKALNGTTTACPPIYQAGSCAKVCVGESGTSYSTCSWNGKAFRAITTRLQPSSIYKCGDGVCQFTESCGTSNTFDSCFADCGACP